MLFCFQNELLHWAFYVIFDAYRNRFFVGPALCGILKGEDDLFIVEIGAVCFADDFVEVSPYKWYIESLWANFEETVSAIQILDEVCTDYCMEFI